MHAPIRPETAKPPDAGEIRSIIIGLVLAMLLAALDQTIVATAMPTMGREMHDLEHLPWVVTGYLLAATAVTPLYGKLSDIHGRRVMLQIGIVTFVVGSVACALSTSILFLSAARVVQGLGGGGLISLAQTIIADIVAPRERARYQVHIASVFVISSLAGPLMGGFFAEHFHWSLIFWINAPLGLAAYIMTNANLRRLPRHERPHDLDMIGAAFLVTATCAMLLALTWGGVRYDWSSAPILGLAGVAAVVWTLFVWRINTAPEPLIPLAVLANPVVRAGTLAACFGMGAFIGLAIYLPIYFEGVYRLTASQSGLALVPFMVGTVTGATISGRLLASATHYKRLPIIGLCVSVIAALILALAPERLPLSVVEIILTLISLGLGTILPVCTVTIQNAVALHELGTTTGAANFFRQLGGAISVAAFGAIVLGGAAALSGTRLGHGISFEVLAAADQNGASLNRLFRYVFAAAAAELGLALICMIALEERPLRSSVGSQPPST